MLFFSIETVFKCKFTRVVAEILSRDDGGKGVLLGRLEGHEARGWQGVWEQCGSLRGVGKHMN